MNRLFNKKSKKSLKSHISLGILPINVAAGPLGLRAELDIGSKGEQGRLYHDPAEVDGPDLTVVPGVNGTGASRIVLLQENESEYQPPPAPEPLAPGPAIDTEHENNPTSEHSQLLPSRAVFMRIAAFYQERTPATLGKKKAIQRTRWGVRVDASASFDFC